MTREERKDAIKFFKEVAEREVNNAKYSKLAIEALVQEPKTGHWVKIKPYPLQMHDYECSECGHETDDNTENYCSDCGAKMIEQEESNYIKDIVVINNKIKDLSERVETLEKQIKEDKEEQLKRLKAEVDYAKFRCTL